MATPRAGARRGNRGEPSCEIPRRPGRGVLAEALRALFTEGPLARYAGLVAAEIGLGRRFVYVLAEEGLLGIAYAPPVDAPLPSWLVEERHSLSELAGYAWSHPLLTSVALAAANAATQAVLEENPGLVDWRGDIVEALGGVEGSSVALVGYVPGVAERLASGNPRLLVVYEDNPRHIMEARERGLDARPGSQLLVEAGDYDVILATGASLVDPRLLVAARGSGARLALVGPTSSFHPWAAERLGLQALGGSHIPRRNRPRLLRLVKAGMGFRRIRGLVEKWAWKRPS